MRLVIVNQKGGVGKTTVATNLSYGLSRHAKNTLLIDLDPQAHSSIIYQKEINPEKTIKEAFIDRSYEMKNIIFPAQVDGLAADNLFITPSSIHLAVTAEQIASKIHREKLLCNHLKKIEKPFDYIIMDCPPTLGVIAINAIYAADVILIPSTYGRYSLDGVADLFNSIEEIKEGKTYKYYILRNSFESRNKNTNEFIDSQLSRLGGNLLNTIIRKNEAINQAQINGVPVSVFDQKSNGANDFEALTNEVINHV